MGQNINVTGVDVFSLKKKKKRGEERKKRKEKDYPDC